MKKKVILVLSLFIILSPFLFPAPRGLSTEGFKALSIFIVCITWWITGIAPIMITSLLAIILFPLLGLANSEETYRYFGNTAVFFLIGSFILSSALRRVGITKRIAIKFIEKFGTNSKRLVLGFLSASYFLSLWMISHAVVAVLLPIVLEFSEDFDDRLLKPLFLSILWGSTLGGNTTMLGGGRAPLVFAMLQPYYDKGLSFVKWMMYSFPITFLLLLISALVLFKMTPEVDIPKIKITHEKFRGKQFRVFIIAISTIALWMFSGEKLGVSNIALGAVVALFLTDSITWREVEEDVNWGIILMYGGAIVLGNMMNQTGVAKWLVGIFNLNEISQPFLIFAFFAFGILLTEMMSNSAAAVIITQASFPLIGNFGIPPEALTVLISMSTGFAFILPTGSPSVAMISSTGYIEEKELVRYGIVMSGFSIVVSIFMIELYWKYII